jgi:outer membrane protein assembly factor BamB
MDLKGDITDKKNSVKWRYTRNGPSTCSPIRVGVRLMFVSDKGVVTCIDSRNGKRLWVKRVGGNFCASPIAADGLVYFFDRDGKATIFRAGDKPEVVATNKLNEGMMASPSVIGGRLLLRTTSHLYCIGK